MYPSSISSACVRASPGGRFGKQGLQGVPHLSCPLLVKGESHEKYCGISNDFSPSYIFNNLNILMFT